MLLTTPRLFLLPLEREILRSRLDHEHFSLECCTPIGNKLIHFPSEWPGAIPLAMFPVWLTRLLTDEEPFLDSNFVAVESQSLKAIGLLGSKGTVSPSGEVEIGYGFNPDVWGQGYATEAVSALVSHLHAQPDVREVIAQTLSENAASQRVLAKTGFWRVETHWEKEPDALMLWAHHGG